ncbi:BirA family biotin operon repressor/biotin-[acetyl-CoA-carboxylase] ligase [Pseudoclavibacter chungangensis]|uniref:biotin--[acetyl-CoA-carboxylase] ligase n=1 Tax=Pseudoclavibacter chungangensis TaxID=587635 RepID=UPI0015C963F4|nr:biotin--[acetyl-CoA-carboxylase] ligase [Pseudoclavibacter chungangensis]NYJ67684.1 BirA family biotin operon repressor/biotin-[acetyl-CoA-carboxylase] ligase [Pseudoclavibacter chungangensis]
MLIRLDSSPSTLDAARERWRADVTGRVLPHLSSVVTSDQTGGRGRLGRVWSSPPDTGLAIATVLRFRDAPTVRESLGLLPLLAALALREAAVAELDDDAARVLVKWPNDVLVDGRKVAGILGEVLGARDGELACAIGTGVNVSLTEAELPVPTATSLGIAAGRPVDANRVLDRYLAELTRRVDGLVAANWNAVDAGVVSELQRTSATLGTRVRVTLPDHGALVGDAVEITPAGHLVVRTDDGARRTVVAGDVQRVRPDGQA